MKHVMNFGKVIVAMVVSASFMVACGNKSNDDSSTNPYGQYGAYGANCISSCVQGGVPVTNATATYMGMQFNLQLFGSPQAVMYAQQTGTFYQGPIAIGGSLQVSGASVGACYLPPGQYMVSTLQGSQITSGSSLGNLRIQATGPSTIVIDLYDAYYLSTSQSLHASAASFSIGMPGYGVQNCGTIML